MMSPWVNLVVESTTENQRSLIVVIATVAARADRIGRPRPERSGTNVDSLGEKELARMRNGHDPRPQ
jgi:hypothetical protein